MSPQAMPILTLERLRHLVAAYGADPLRWPESEREPAISFIGGSVAARDLVTHARELDSVLTVASADVPEAAMARLTAATAFPPLQQRSSLAKGSVGGWLSNLASAFWPRATVFASMMALGIVTGLAIEPVTSGSEVNATVIGDFNVDMGEELEL